MLMTGKYLKNFLDNCNVEWIDPDTTNNHITIVHKCDKKHQYKVNPAEQIVINLEDKNYLLVDYYYLLEYMENTASDTAPFN
jgi:hypothetical protein